MINNKISVSSIPKKKVMMNTVGKYHYQLLVLITRTLVFQYGR